MDSNHRRHSRQIYSLLPLATRATLRITCSFSFLPTFLLGSTTELARGLEPLTTCLQNRCSAIELRQPSRQRERPLPARRRRGDREKGAKTTSRRADYASKTWARRHRCDRARAEAFEITTVPKLAFSSRAARTHTFPVGGRPKGRPSYRDAAGVSRDVARALGAAARYGFFAPAAVTVFFCSRPRAARTSSSVKGIFSICAFSSARAVRISSLRASRARWIQGDESPSSRRGRRSAPARAGPSRAGRGSDVHEGEEDLLLLLGLRRGGGGICMRSRCSARYISPTR